MALIDMKSDLAKGVGSKQSPQSFQDGHSATTVTGQKSFGQPPRIAPDGMQVSAVRGLIQTLLSLTRQSDVTHLAVAFDSEIKSFRNDLYENYKDGSDTPEDLRLQFPLAERAVHSLGICIWPAYDFEADDVLGSAEVG